MELNETGTLLSDNALKLKSFKEICGKVSITVCVYFLCRIVCDALQLTAMYLLPDLGITSIYLICTVLSIIFIYIIPLTFTIVFLGVWKEYAGNLAPLYKKPDKLARAMGNFPALYGFGQAVNLLTLLALFIISVLFNGESQNDLTESYRGLTSTLPPNFACACIYSFLAIVIAPLAEEFWVRGVLMNLLKPYGNAFAIIITAVIFGAMHSNIKSLFFTTALGLAFGYITYATGSIFVSTVMHVIFNAISSFMLMFMSTDSIKAFMDYGLINNEILTVLFIFYMFIVYASVFIGLVYFIKKIKIIRRYKVSNDWSDLKLRKKVAVYVTSLSTVVWILLAVNAHLGDPIVEEISKVFT